MKILFVASEAYPFVKIGGLADVAFALPKALRKLGVDVRVMIPKYSNISSNYKTKMIHINHFYTKVAWRNQYCGIEYLQYKGVPFYFIDNEYYFKRNETYGFYDDGERYSYFCNAVLDAIQYIEDFTPDIIHCNDWHTGMIPVILNDKYRNKDQYKNIKTVFTIHNLKYQGVFGRQVLEDLIGISDAYYDENKLKYYDGVSFMKGGIKYSDFVTTVSGTYAEEVKTPQYGEGLHGLFIEKGDKFKGIVNGIDYDIYNPLDDKDIYFNYSIDNIQDKVKNKLELQKYLNFPVSKDIPMIGIVSRLVDQKGFDLIANQIEEILKMNVQMVVLGTGQDNYKDLFQYYAYIYPSKLSAHIYFSNEFSKKIYASSDMFLMPSLFEPCGISQLIAQRYGTLPIVRETGGLKDTVKPYNCYTGKGTGFSFRNYNGVEMVNAIRYAVEVYKDKNAWNELVKQCMLKDNSWEKSAEDYKKLYESLR